MKKFGKLEGKKYTFKKKALEKNKKKHLETYKYILKNILNNEKALENLQKILKLSNAPSEKMIEKIGLKIMEDIAKDLNLDETIIYSERKFNKQLLKELKRQDTKQTKQLTEFIEQIKENKKGLKRKFILNPWEFLKALYLYTISEV